MLKNPIHLGQGLSILGSLGGIFSFFGFSGSSKEVERTFELTSTIEGTDWKSGFVTPIFNSNWLGGVFEKPTSYSYGYVARVKGTDFFETRNASKKIKRDLSKQQEPEGKLTLIEKAGDTTILEDSKNTDRKGLTPKKFLLIGSNRTTGEIEVTGLLSLIQFGHRGINNKCSKQEDQGAILDGSCDKVFFNFYKGEETAPTFIEKELKKENSNEAVSILRLKLEKKSLGVVWGRKNNGEKKWSRTGYLYLAGNSSKGSKEVRRAWTSVNDRGAKGFFVVHDLIFGENGMSKGWIEKKERWGNILVEGIKNKGDFRSDYAKAIQALNKSSNVDKVIDIPLSTNRNYYIWDPNKTNIKKGEFLTEDGQKLPFKLNLNVPWTSALIK